MSRRRRLGLLLVALAGAACVGEPGTPVRDVGQDEIIRSTTVVEVTEGPAIGVTVGAVPPGFFEDAGWAPTVGRLFVDEDHVAESSPTVVLSTELWERLGGDPGVVGTRLVVGGMPRTVVGVLPGGSGGADGVDLFVARPPDRPSADSASALVDALFAEVDGPDSPGAAVVVVRDGEVLLSRGYGSANLEHRIPITPATVFDIASVSKQFTGMAISMLVEGGEISLDDDVRAYIPELPDFGPTITIDHLVHHTSGLRDWPGTLRVAGWRMDDVISFDQILRLAFAQQDLNFTPGAEYTYSNTGYNLLAEVVARVGGRSFREWTDEHIFRPLGMDDTHFHDDHTEVVPNRAYGYARTGEGEYRAVHDGLTAMGSSSLYTTVQDMARWLANFDEPGVGGRSVLERMKTRGVLNDGSRIPYAFGLNVGEYRGLPTVAHGGSWASFRTALLHFPEQRFGTVVLQNYSPSDPSGRAREIADIYLAGVLAESEAGDEGEQEEVDVPAPVLDAYAGVYRLGPGWYVRIRRSGSNLRVRATGEDEFPMSARSATEFWIEAYGATMSFARDESGRVTHLLYRGVEAPKLEESPAPSVAELEELEGEYWSEELATLYHAVVEEGSLVMRHRRHGTLPLTHAWGDDFAGSGPLGSVEFQRNAAGDVTGLLVNAGRRNRDLRFVKRR